MIVLYVLYHLHHFFRGGGANDNDGDGDVDPRLKCAQYHDTMG